MESSEAKLYLPCTDDESLEDVYDQKLFEWKNFFVNRFPIPKLFDKKIEQLKRLQEAYSDLGGSAVIGTIEPETATVFSKNLKESFLKYSEERYALKMRLFTAGSAHELTSLIQALLKLTAAYAAVWENKVLDVSGVVVSKEPDPMDLLQALNDAESLGVQTVDQVKTLPADHLVLNEAKRLSLWVKMEKND